MKKFRVKFKIDTIIEAEDKEEALERVIENITDYFYWGIPIYEIIEKISIEEIDKARK